MPTYVQYMYSLLYNKYSRENMYYSTVHVTCCDVMVTLNHLSVLCPPQTLEYIVTCYTSAFDVCTQYMVEPKLACKHR